MVSKVRKEGWKKGKWKEERKMEERKNSKQERGKGPEGWTNKGEKERRLNEENEGIIDRWKNRDGRLKRRMEKKIERRK